MVTKVVVIESEALRAALENPNKNYVLICENHHQLKHVFTRIADEVVQKLSELPIMINKTSNMFIMPEGGQLRLFSFHARGDVDRLQGYRYADYFIDESCEQWTRSFGDLCYAMLKAHKRQ